MILICSVGNPQSAAKASLSVMRAGSLLLDLHNPTVTQKPNTYNQLEAPPAPRFPLPPPCLTGSWATQYWMKLGGHRATKTNINMGLWGAAGQDSRAGPLIGVTDRSNNKPCSVFPRSGCPPQGQQLGGSVLCQCKPLSDCSFPFLFSSSSCVSLFVRALLERQDHPAPEDLKAYG